ncbi:MAG: hypothetical protein WKF56_01270 [Candidatus Limnocylindrales bacterium]
MTTWRALDARSLEPGPFHVRTDHPDGSKSITWRSPSGGRGLGDHRMEDLVYAERVPLPARIVLTEGEKAADAVRAAGIAAVGTVCGASATPGPHVVSLFSGVRVTLWPDADRVGFDHMARLSQVLEPGVQTLRLVDLPAGVPDGWDAADADPATIRRLVAAAHDIWLSTRVRPLELAS